MNERATRIGTYPALEPGQSRAGKFLQLRCDGIPWLLFCTPDTYRFHNQLLARFLGDEGIDHHWVDEETLEVPADRVIVAGGGRYHLDLAAGTLDLWDDSHAYGRFDEERVTAQLANAGEPWSNLRLVIR